MTSPAQPGSGGARPGPERRPAAPPPAVEHTHWSWGLVGFYMSCAGTALGATFAAAGPLFFGSTTAMVFGIVLGVVSIVTCFLSLAAARRRPAA